MEVQRLFYFPVKGFAGTELSSADIRTDHGIPFDRAFAFHYKDEYGPDGVHTRSIQGPPTASLHEFPWVNKRQLTVQHDWPALARLRCEFDPATSRIRIADARDGMVVEASLGDEAQRAELSRFVGQFLSSATPSSPSRRPLAGEVELVGNTRGSSRYPDRAKMHVSILNLASLRDLEQAVGSRLDIRRFRGNLIIDGIPAWSELEWEGKAADIGSSGARIDIKAPILRCHNVNVDPDTGEDQIRALEILKERFGHTKFGVIGTVAREGTVAVGDKLALG